MAEPPMIRRDIRSSTAPADSKPDAAELEALHHVHERIGKRLDALRKDADMPEEKSEQPPEREEHHGQIAELLAEIRALRSDVAGMGRRLDNIEQPPTEKIAASNTRDDDESGEEAEGEEPKQLAADSADDDNVMAEKQHRFDSVAMLNGRSLERPRIGDSLLPYCRRSGRVLQSLLAEHDPLRTINLEHVKDRKGLLHLTDQIAAAAERAAKENPQGLQGRQMRAVTKQDATGRKITEWVAFNEYGDPALGDWFQQLRAPTFRVKITRPYNHPYND